MNINNHQISLAMKKLIVLLSVVFFITIYATKAFSQENNVESLRFKHDFNLIGLKSEKQAIWIDSVLTAQTSVFSCHTDYITGHTQIVVQESLNSPVLMQSVFLNLGVEIDKSSYKSKYDQ